MNRYFSLALALILVMASAESGDILQGGPPPPVTGNKVYDVEAGHGGGNRVEVPHGGGSFTDNEPKPIPQVGEITTTFELDPFTGLYHRVIPPGQATVIEFELILEGPRKGQYKIFKTQNGMRRQVGHLVPRPETT